MTLLCGLCGLVGSARADPNGLAGGRLLLRAGTSEVSLAAARAAVGGDKIVLELRRGAQVLEASLDEDGYFWLKAPAGAYRLEYLRVGKRAEFFAPQEIVVQPAALTCAGTIALELDQIESLGANVNNRVTVTDQCAETTPRLRRVAGTAAERGIERVVIAQPAPQFEHFSHLGWRDLVIGLRAEAAVSDHPIVRGLVRLPPLAREGVFSRWILLVGVGGLRGDRNALVYDVTLGAGVHVAVFDLLAVTGARWPEAQGVQVGPVVGGVARLHSTIMGLGVRVEALPSRAAFFTIDLAPLGLLGSLL
ncbi:MAG TPA: hypothetical protein VF516_09810 [Kofleriaceae bacterium]